MLCELLGQKLDFTAQSLMLLVVFLISKVPNSNVGNNPAVFDGVKGDILGEDGSIYEVEIEVTL